MPPRVLHTAIAASALACAALLVACPGESPDAPPGDDDVVVRVGDVSFTKAQLDEWLDWSKRVDPALAEPKIRRITLSDFLLPRAIAQSLAGPKSVALARARAETFYTALVDAGGSTESFRRLGQVQNVSQTWFDDYIRPFNQLPFDLSRAAFETSVGNHSAVLESTIGFGVVAVIDKKTEVYETRKIVTADFPYLDAVDFGTRVRKLAVEILREPAWAHPLYREDFRSLLRELSDEWPPPASTDPSEKTPPK